MKKYNWDGVIAIKWRPIELAQTILKMCYSYDVSEFGFGTFTPNCLDQIRCINGNLSYLIGQNGINIAIDGESKTSNLEPSIFISPTLGVLVTCTCSLFPGAGTPIYETVIGRIETQNQVAALQKQIADKGFTVAPRPVV